MATYLELARINDSSAAWNDFRDKAAFAVVKKAQTVLDSTTPTAGAVAWSIAALKAPGRTADELIPYIIAANSTATITQILNATDSAIQNNINAAADVILGAA